MMALVATILLSDYDDILFGYICYKQDCCLQGSRVAGREKIWWSHVEECSGRSKSATAAAAPKAVRSAPRAR